MKKRLPPGVVLGLWIAIFCPYAVQGQEVPAGTVLELRLRNMVSTYTAKRGDVVRAVLIASVQRDGREILPAGLEVHGRVERVKRVGLGVIRERARLQLSFFSLTTPGTASVDITSQIIEIENAREQIRGDGEIVGIRATDSYGHQTLGMVTSAAAIDPLLSLFAFAGASSVLRFPEAEITYPAGTELQIKLLKDLQVGEIACKPMAHVTTSEGEVQSLGVYVNELPFRTRTKTRNIASDVTNLVFFGTKTQVVKAFAEAGWTAADNLNSGTKYKTVRALAESRGYAEAPVSQLLLAGEPPALVFEKGLNTINRRHHLRVWQIADDWNGQMVWTAAATHDIGLVFSSQKRLIHRIDSEIDKERSKVANDLRFADCVESGELVERPRVPRVTSNATGDSVFTDGRVEVLRLKDCAQSKDTAAREKNAKPRLGNVVYRGVRQFDLTMRNSLIRDNVASQAYRGGRLIWKAAHHRSSPTLGLVPETSAPEYLGEPRLVVARRSSKDDGSETSRPRLPEVAFSLDGGQFFRRHLGNLYLASVNSTTGEVDVFQYSMHIDPGVVLGASVTLKPSRLFSHELYFGTMQGNLVTGDPPDPQVDRLMIRSTGYQLEANLAPRRWRLRPFATAGSDLTTYRFRNIKLTKKNGLFKFGLHNVGTVVNAFSSAGAAPLDGGTVYRTGLTYGGGIKYRISRLVEFQVEYRESYAKDPNFFNKQSFNYSVQGINTAQDAGTRSHSSYILSFSFTP